MAIEFHCPYCTAVIRVADEYAGRQGRCPKCDTRLQIPVLSRSDGAGGSQPNPSAITESETTPGIRSDADRTMDGHRPSTPGASAAPSSPVVVTAGTAAAAVRPWQRRRKSRRSRRIWLVGLPVIGFLILFGVLAAIMMSRMPELKGTLPAQVLSERTLPPAVIAWSAAGLSPEQQTTLKTTLAEFPESFSSELMTCSLVGTEDGIEVQLKAGDGYAWFVVAPETHAPLLLWSRLHQEELNAQRIKELRTQTVEYCRDKLRAIDGERIVINAALYRDAVGLSAHLKALSYALEAVAAGRVTRCVREDQNGQLYFLLPESTQSFVIRGRLMADGIRQFPGEYQATVTAASRSTADEKSAEDPPDIPLETPTKSDEVPMSDDAANGPPAVPDDPPAGQATEEPSPANAAKPTETTPSVGAGTP